MTRPSLTVRHITDNDDSISGTPSGYHSRHYGVILELEDGQLIDVSLNFVQSYARYWNDNTIYFCGAWIIRAMSEDLIEYGVPQPFEAESEAREKEVYEKATEALVSHLRKKDDQFWGFDDPDVVHIEVAPIGKRSKDVRLACAQAAALIRERINGKSDVRDAALVKMLFDALGYDEFNHTYSIERWSGKWEEELSGMSEERAIGFMLGVEELRPDGKYRMVSDDTGYSSWDTMSGNRDYDENGNLT